MATIGTHCLLEMYDCSGPLLDDLEFVKAAVRAAAEAAGATLLGEVSHRYSPQGVTAVGLIAESHLAIHTWPEHNYAAADVFTCGDRARAEAACLHLATAFKAGRHSLTKLARGPELGAGAPLPAPSIETCDGPGAR